MALDIGLMFSFRNPEYNRKPWDEFYENELDLCAYCEEVGLDHVWLTEHHFVDDGYSPSLMAIAANIAARTKKIRIGTFVLLMPLHDPVMVAEDAATVDVMSSGRFDLGMGLGYRPGEFTGLGISSKERGARLSEGAPLIKELLEGGEVDHEGKFYTAKNVRLVPPAIQQPHPPIWIGARGDAALDRAAQHGFHLASVGAPEHRANYIEALKRHGRNPDDFNIGQLVCGYTAPDTNTAWDRSADGISHVLQAYIDWTVESGDQTGEGDWDLEAKGPSGDHIRQARDPDFFGQPCHVGDPDAMYESLKAYLEASPCTHLVVMMSLPGTDPEHTRESIKLFAEEVAPRLRAL
jgi:alkanesulfonate monooxygenase SsuD/methylene tetrahydromethanopterin reductase-like flavin-dependent oxidoreductase (luciferase family)